MSNAVLLDNLLSKETNDLTKEKLVKLRKNASLNLSNYHSTLGNHTDEADLPSHDDHTDHTDHNRDERSIKHNFRAIIVAKKSNTQALANHTDHENHTDIQIG